MSLVWLYAVGPEGTVPPDVAGVDGERPRPVTADGLTAVVGDVGDEGFGEDGLAAAMEDLTRIGQLARAHHAVVAGVVGPVAPLRLATVYRDDSAVERLLGERATELRSVLDRVRGCREWGVKVWVPPAARPRTPESGPDDRPGTAYLRRRQSIRDRADEARERTRAFADLLHTELAGRAVAARCFAPQDPRLGGRGQEMVLNATYLVDRDREQEFRDVLTGSGDGPTVELTGPWPPFSFATLDGGP